jgi:hypothetical protein
MYLRLQGGGTNCRDKAFAATACANLRKSTKDWERFLRTTCFEIFLNVPIQEDEGGSFVFCKKLLG